MAVSPDAVVIDELEREVREALTRGGLGVRSLANVTTIRFPSYIRATYRIDLESGEIIKARCFADEATATRLFEIRRRLPDAFVPAFSRHGRILFEQWVVGRVVGNTEASDALLREAAHLLAVLHETTPPEVTPNEDATGDWRRRTDEGLRILGARAALRRAELARLLDAVERCDPKRMVMGLGHFDFCGENMVVDEAGRLRVFDNERMGAGPLGFDLGRTWYRWTLSRECWQVFREAYASAAARADVLREFEFWSIAVLVHSACLRLDTDRSRLSVPLDRLRGLA